MTANDPDPVTSVADLVAPDEGDIGSLMMRKAGELFEACDAERKGFITKRDMQRLQTQIPMTAEQLADVFVSLDKDGNGYVTINDFTQGFGGLISGVDIPIYLPRRYAPEREEAGAKCQLHSLSCEERGCMGHFVTGLVELKAGAFLGLASSSSAIEKRKSPEGHVTAESVYENDHVGAVVRDEEDEEDMRRTLNDIFTTNQETGIDLDSAERLWRMLRSYHHHPDLLDNFESFLHCVTKELKRSHADYRSLEAALRHKNITHDEDMKKLYEEMETQISIEKQKALAAERAKERQLKEDMETEMREKDRQVNELLIHRKQLQEKLNDMNDQEEETKQENIKLQTAKNKLEQSLVEAQHLMEESQTYANQLRSQEKQVTFHQTLTTLHVTEGIALERESLVKQLNLLRDMNRKLRDETEEAELRRMRTNRRS